MISRAELGELYRADDEARAEHAEWQARRQAQARPFVRTQEETPADTPEPDPWAGWNAWMRGHLDIERRSICEEVENALVELVVLLRKDWHDDIKKAITERDAEIVHLRGQVETLTRLYAGKSADIHDLPNWRPKDVA
jgi:hypothetical protein